MKKLFLVLAAAFAMVACQTDINEVGVVADGVAAVEFEVGAPQMRSFSDGMTATVLQYAVYDAQGEELSDLRKEAVELVNGRANVKIELANNKSYSIIFWAEADNAPYTVDFANKTVTVDYTNAECNDESRDAFYAYKEFEVKGAATLGVELRRPFAQVNVGTSDLAEAAKSNFVPSTSALIVEDVFSTLNLVDGTALGNTTDVTFAATTVPAGEEFKVAGHDYLAMSYVLVGKDKGSYDVTYTINAADGTVITNTIGAVPMQANYRTNIYGKLLTSTTDINVEINPDYNEPDYSVYNVMVDGVSYDDFAVAVAKAMELNKSIEFIQNVTIDADETITVPAGKTLTLNLNGHTLSGVTDDADKNDDGNITSADNEVMFDVRGTMNVNKGRVTIKHVGDSYANFGWSACGEAFYVAFNGVLNVNEATIENFGGVPMAYAIDLVNASATRCDEAGVHLNVESSVLKSSYIPVRVFNNGAGMNHVTIKNSTLEGTSRAFWVHVYSSADNGGKGVKDATLNIDIYNNGNTFIANSEDRLIEYGFDDEINVTPQGVIVMKDAEGNVIEGIGMDLEGNYAVTAAAGLDWVANNVAACNGKTIELHSDITLPDGFHPIGYNPTNGEVTTYEGTFDGKGNTIKNLKQQNLGGAYTQSVGLFAKVHNTTIKNLVVEDFSASIYGAEAGVVATWATGDCTFEGITVKSGDVVAYNCETGGVVGWAESGNFTFKDITIGSDVTVSSLWNSYDTPVGGVIGGVGNSNGYTMSVTLENINVACQLDVYNDVSSNYQWGAYRRAGMLIGNIRKTQTIDGTTYPDPVAEGVTCKNVTVTYGKWMNYHYCEFKSNGHGSYDDDQTWKCSRVEGSDWGSDTIDTSKCQHESFESHNMCLPIDQLFGGDQGVYGLATYDGVTVNYPAEYTCPTCGQQHNVK